MRGPVDPWRRVEANRSSEAGSLSDYTSWSSSDPSFAAAGADIVAQLQAEGASTTIINGAKSSFGKAVDDLSSQMGIQIDDPVAAGKSYVLNGFTVAGAVSTIEGLASAVQSGSPVEITQAFSGVMIGLGIAAGAFSAGVGAAIVAGVGGLMSILQSQGLFGGNQGFGICGGVAARAQPDLVVGCLAGFTNPNNGGAGGSPQVPPGDTQDWRTFPAKTKLDDASWYLPCGGGGCGDFTWRGVTWSNKYTSNPPGPMRPIDWAFPAFQSAEAYIASPIGPPGFTDGLCAALKSNWEYGLNGLKIQDDAMVLAHYVRMWNIAHAPSPVIPLSAIAQQTPQWNYLHGLVPDALTHVVNPETDRWGTGDLAINAGPVHAAPQRVVHLTIPKQVVRLTMPHLATAAASAPKSTGPSSAGTALAIGAMALGAAMIWKPAWLRKVGVRL